MVYQATLSTKGVLNAQLSTAFVDKSKVATYSSLFEFPNRGVSDCIYISRDDNATYRWDEANSKYFCIGRDYENIENIICGGNA